MKNALALIGLVIVGLGGLVAFGGGLAPLMADAEEIKQAEVACYYPGVSQPAPVYYPGMVQSGRVTVDCNRLLKH